MKKPLTRFHSTPERSTDLLLPGWHKIDPVNEDPRILVEKVTVQPRSFAPEHVAQLIREEVSLAGYNKPQYVK